MPRRSCRARPSGLPPRFRAAQLRVLPHEVRMSIVAGVDFGTLSVRVSIFDSARGKLGAGVAEYPLLRKKDDPDHATQSHADHMRALAAATRRAIADAGIDGTRHRSHGARYHRLQRDSRRRPPRAARRLLPLVRPPRLEAKPREITAAAHAPQPGSHRLVRRRLLLRMGLRQTAALAAPQSRQARALRHRPGTLRYGRRRALRHHRPGAGSAQHLRHGPQVDVERARSAACPPRSS